MKMETEIFQHGDGSWRVMLFARDFASQEDACDWVGRAQMALPRGFFEAPTSETVGYGLRPGNTWAAS